MISDDGPLEWFGDELNNNKSYGTVKAHFSRDSEPDQMLRRFLVDECGRFYQQLIRFLTKALQEFGPFEGEGGPRRGGSTGHPVTARLSLESFSIDLMPFSEVESFLRRVAGRVARGEDEDDHEHSYNRFADVFQQYVDFWARDFVPEDLDSGRVHVLEHLQAFVSRDILDRLARDRVQKMLTDTNTDALRQPARRPAEDSSAGLAGCRRASVFVSRRADYPQTHAAVEILGGETEYFEHWTKEAAVRTMPRGDAVMPEPAQLDEKKLRAVEQELDERLARNLARHAQTCD